MWNRLKNFLGLSVQDWEQPIWDSMSSNYGTSSGQVISEATALSIGAVYACVNIKANAVAKLPLQLFKHTSSGRSRESSHAIAKLIEQRPNKHMTPFLFKHTITVHRNLWGVAYVLMKFDYSGKVVELEILEPSKMSVVTDSSEQKWFVYSKEKNPIVYDESEIIRLPYLTLDGFTPKTPISVARETAGTMLAAQKFLGGFYKNGTLTKGILKIPGTLNKDAKKKVRESWMEVNSGMDNAGRIAILDGGIEFQNISMPLEDAEYIASMKFNVEEVARIFNVPLHMINSLDRATFSNIEHQSMAFIQDTIQPELIAWEEELNYKLFTSNEQKKYYVKFNLASALRGDSASRAQYYKEMIGMGIYSINEVRSLEEKDSIDLGDKHLVSLNFTTLDNLEQYQLAKAGMKGGEDDGISKD